MLDDFEVPEPDFRKLFEQLPGLYMVLDTDLHIVAASDAYLQATLTRREEIIGRYVFDVFPDNPDDPSADAMHNSLASFKKVLRDGKTDVMLVQRHDVRRPKSEGGEFETRYWSPINSPIKNTDGSVAYILHKVENVTDYVLLKQQGVEQDKMTNELSEQTLQMEADLYARSREVAEAGRKLKQANEALRKAHTEQEERITGRTAELREANTLLRDEIAEHKLDESALRESEDRLAFALETIHTGAWDLDLVDRTAHRSADHDRIFGYEQMLPEWTYQRFLDHVLPDDRAEVDAEFQHAIETKGDWNFECRIRRADGEIRWIWAAGRHRPDAAGVMRRMAGIVQDITERKLAEDELRESESREMARAAELQAFVDAVPGIVFIAHDLEGRNMTGSRATYEFLRVTMEESVSKSALDDGKPISFRAMKNGVEVPPEELPVQQAARGHEVRDYELDIVFSDGIVRTILGNASPVLDEQGNPRGAVGAFVDVTEQKRTEEALKESERLYRAVGESIDYGIWVCAPDGRNIYASESFLKLVGLTQEQCSEFGWGDVLHPDDAERTIAAWKECVRTGDNWSIEHRFRGVDGKWHPILARGVPVRDEEGQITCWAGINLDISELKHVEDALRESRAKLEAALESMTDAVFISDSEANFIDFNEAFATFHRFENKEECLKSLAEYPDILEVYTAEGKLAELENWAVPRALRGEVVTNAEYSLRRKDTGEEWVGSYSFAPIKDDKGAIVGSVVVARDITEQKKSEDRLRESEQRFRTMVDAIPQLAWMANSDGYIFWYNQRWYDYTGTTPEQMEGWGWQSVHDPEALPKVLDRWTSSIATGEPFDMEFPLKGADGKFRPFLTRVLPMKDEQGVVIRWFGTNTDVSEMREVEAHKREFYRRTILAATEGKLVISERQEVEALIEHDCMTWDMFCYEDVAGVREQIGKIARDAGMQERRVYEFLGCVVEAAGNAVKHTGSGKAHLCCDVDGFTFVVSDSGPGIGAIFLPDVALTKGYSTAGTLGMGYKLIIEMADKVYLATDAQGTTVAIEMSLHKVPTPLEAASPSQITGWTG